MAADTTPATPPAPAWARVRTLADLDSLNKDDILDGFRDGYEDTPEPQPGGNRSRGYWHGWRNGMLDRGRIPQDAIHAELCRLYYARLRAERERVA